MPRHLKPADARGLASDVLVRVATTEAFADIVLAEQLAAHHLAPADAALATRLVYGVLAWQGRLDHHLGTLVHQSLASLHPAVLVALRLGLYQLLFLDRVPDYAAVDASVRLARRAAGRGAAGLVNAVLRRVTRSGRDALPLPSPADRFERLAIEWSHPRWLVERWAAELGLDTLPAVLAADNTEGPITLRVDATRTTREAVRDALAQDHIEAMPTRFAPHGLVLPREASRVRSLPLFRDGLVAFQSEASQLVVALVGAQPGERVFDACAAPGGKTAALASAVGPNGQVVALDPYRGGARRIRDTARRHHVTVSAVVGDARQPPVRGPFDAVLVDAPCSGLGTLRRHPEVRWRRTAGDIPRLASLQAQLLRGVASLVRPGGRLVYAVCTRTAEETDGVARTLLADGSGFVLDDAAQYLPSDVVDGGALRTLPHRHDLDGFFAVRLRRTA